VGLGLLGLDANHPILVVIGLAVANGHGPGSSGREIA
jgi:hypothetical protein